jgi:hypothetical protein
MNGKTKIKFFSEKEVNGKYKIVRACDTDNYHTWVDLFDI